MNNTINLNPGSEESVSRGCMCPVLDNGRGNEELGNTRGFYTTSECPLHGEDSSPTTPAPEKLDFVSFAQSLGYSNPMYLPQETKTLLSKAMAYAKSYGDRRELEGRNKALAEADPSCHYECDFMLYGSEYRCDCLILKGAAVNFAQDRLQMEKNRVKILQNRIIELESQKEKNK